MKEMSIIVSLGSWTISDRQLTVIVIVLYCRVKVNLIFNNECVLAKALARINTTENTKFGANFSFFVRLHGQPEPLVILGLLLTVKSGRLLKYVQFCVF